MTSSPIPRPPAGISTGGTGRPRRPAELAELRAQLREAHETIEAIRGGGVDSLVIGPPGQEQLYALATADRPYRLIFEAAPRARSPSPPRDNPRRQPAARPDDRPATHLPGTAVLDLVPEAHRPAFARLLDIGAGQSARGEA